MWQEAWRGDGWQGGQGHGGGLEVAGHGGEVGVSMSAKAAALWPGGDRGLAHSTTQHILQTVLKQDLFPKLLH